MAAGAELPFAGECYAVVTENGFGLGEVVGTDFGTIVSIDGISGFKVVSRDNDYSVAPGAATGITSQGVRVVNITARLTTTNLASEMEAAFVTGEEAWAPDETDPEGRLYFYVPGIGRFYLNGHPGDFEPQRLLAASGKGLVIAEWIATDPFRHPVEAS